MIGHEHRAASFTLSQTGACSREHFIRRDEWVRPRAVEAVEAERPKKFPLIARDPAPSPRIASPAGVRPGSDVDRGRARPSPRAGPARRGPGPIPTTARGCARRGRQRAARVRTGPWRKVARRTRRQGRSAARQIERDGVLEAPSQDEARYARSLRSQHALDERCLRRKLVRDETVLIQDGFQFVPPPESPHGVCRGDGVAQQEDQRDLREVVCQEGRQVDAPAIFDDPAPGEAAGVLAVDPEIPNPAAQHPP